MTTSDMVAQLADADEDLGKFEFTIIKHWDDGQFDERIYVANFDSFVDLVFDLDMRGWELVQFRKLIYPMYLSHSFYAGRVYADFARTEKLGKVANPLEKQGSSASLNPLERNQGCWLCQPP